MKESSKYSETSKMEESSDDENYENFRALSETWDWETSDTDEEDSKSVTGEEEKNEVLLSV